MATDITKETTPHGVGSSAPPDPVWCSECRRWINPICYECNKPAWIITGLYKIRRDHTDCDSGLGWDERHVCSDDAA